MSFFKFEHTLQFEYFKSIQRVEYGGESIRVSYAGSLKSCRSVSLLLPLNTTFEEGVWVCYRKVEFTFFRPLPSLSLSFPSSKTLITILTFQ